MIRRGCTRMSNGPIGNAATAPQMKNTVVPNDTPLSDRPRSLVKCCKYSGRL